MDNRSHEPIPLEDAQSKAAIPAGDPRPRMAEPLPVRLLTVDDASLIAGAGLEKELDAFYVGLLGFERAEAQQGIAYQAENFRILFELVEPPVQRADMRALGIEVASLRETEARLIDAVIQYARQKGLNPGQESLLLQDPAGNWIELSGVSTFSPC